MRRCGKVQKENVAATPANAITKGAVKLGTNGFLLNNRKRAERIIKYNGRLLGSHPSGEMIVIIKF